MKNESLYSDAITHLVHGNFGTLTFMTQNAASSSLGVLVICSVNNES